MLTPTYRIAALTADLVETQDAVEALRAALLDLLIQMPAEMLKTPEGREQIAGEYWLAAGSAHPAVAEVLREAAGRVKDGGR